MKTISVLFIISFINGVVTDESVSLHEGDSVTLHTNIIKIQKDHLIEWRFGDQQDLIAKINGAGIGNKITIYADVLDGRFRDRLQVDDQTGDLTITDITTQHTGDYHLEISNREEIKNTFIFNVPGDKDKVKTVMKGDSVILYNNITKKLADERIVWRIRHNTSDIAEITRNKKDLHTEVLDRFEDRLYVNVKTGNLIITDITPDDFGSYEINITVGSHIYTIHRSFNVPIKEQDQSSGSRSAINTAIICAVILGAVGFIIYLRFYRNEREDGGPPINEETE